MINATIIRPHRDRVLLELIPDDMISTGGIHIPDNSKRKYIRKARVLAVAGDCKQPLFAGQEVYAVWNCGVPVDLGRAQETRLIKSEDIFAVKTATDSIDGNVLHSSTRRHADGRPI